jgi:hypothetical protein
MRAEVKQLGCDLFMPSGTRANKFLQKWDDDQQLLI